MFECGPFIKSIFHFGPMCLVSRELCQPHMYTCVLIRFCVIFSWNETHSWAQVPIYIHFYYCLLFFLYSDFSFPCTLGLSIIVSLFSVSSIPFSPAYVHCAFPFLSLSLFVCFSSSSSRLNTWLNGIYARLNDALDILPLTKERQIIIFSLRNFVFFFGWPSQHIL